MTRWILGVVALIVSGQTATVRAGPVERFVQVLIHDAQPDRIGLRYEHSGGGVILSSDRGKTFRLRCAAAIADDLRPGSAAMDGEGRLWIGSFEGLGSDDGTGCSWTFEPALASRWVVDVVPHPSRPEVTFAAVGAAADSGTTYRREDAAGFRPIGAPDGARVTRLRVVERAGGLRLYQSAVKGSSRSESGSEQPNYVIRYSDDLAATWTEHGFPTTNGTVRLEAVDPIDPDRLLVSVARPNAGTTLHLSRDAGATFARYLELAALGGVAITPEGEVYLGDAGDVSGARTTGGLYRAASLAEAPQRVTDAYAVQCLAYRPSDATLFACDRYVFGTVDRESGELRPLLKLNAVERFVECPGTDVGAQCEAPMRQGYCGLSHFPCAPICDRFMVDISELESGAHSDPSLAACLSRRDPAWQPMAAAAAPAPVAGADRADAPPPDPATAMPPPPAGSSATAAAWSCRAARGSKPGAELALVFAFVVLSLRKRRA